MIGWGFMSQANIPVPGLPMYYVSTASSGGGATASRPFETEAKSHRVLAKGE